MGAWIFISVLHVFLLLANGEDNINPNNGTSPEAIPKTQENDTTKLYRIFKFTPDDVMLTHDSRVSRNTDLDANPIVYEHQETVALNGPQQIETIESNSYHMEVGPYNVDSFEKAPHQEVVEQEAGEVHYHQHKHMHKHKHSQEHMHKHRQQHHHGHGHYHEHQGVHDHKQQSHHTHTHQDENHHSHTGNHHHQHHEDHQHNHEGTHQHDHNHDQEHAHEDVHVHDHKQHDLHVHDHKEKHRHGHNHSHKGIQKNRRGNMNDRKRRNHYLYAKFTI